MASSWQRPSVSDTTRDVAELRQATREAHEVLKDLRRETRALEETLRELETRVVRTVGDTIEATVVRELAALSRATEKAMRDSVAKVLGQFERFETLMFTGRDLK